MKINKLKKVYFDIYDEKKEKLFEIRYLISIYKNNRQEESYFENINLISDNKSMTFTPKRMQIFQMIDDVSVQLTPD